MTRRRALNLAVVLLVLAGVALAVPGTPLYLPNWYLPKSLHDGHSIGHWTKALASSDPEARRKAIFAFGAMGAEAESAVPALAHVLTQDPDPEARIEASLALSKMAPASRAAVPALAQALEDKEGFVRMNSAVALARLGADARPAIPALVKALVDEDNLTGMETFPCTIQERVVIALGRASAGSSEAVPVLLDTLKAAATEEMRMATARALGEVGPEARAAVSRLTVMLKDKNNDVRQAAEDALAKIGTAASVGLSAAECEAQARLEGLPEDLELPDSERQYLWDIEHHGNLLVKHGFGPLANAIKSGDAGALAKLMSEGFAATEIREPQHVRAGGYAEVERLENSGKPALPLNKEAFIGRLLEWRRHVGTAPQVKIALMTLSPKVRGQLNGDWEGTAQLRIFGEHSPGAPAEVVATLGYDVRRPTEELLAVPGWLHSATVLQVLTARAPAYLFADVTRQRGLDTSKLHDNWKETGFLPLPGGVFVCDFDRDGILDVLITDPTGTVLYRGHPNNVFEDVTERMGLPQGYSVRLSAAWIDIDGDGWDDLILGGRIFRNEEGQRFVDYTAKSNLRVPGDASSLVVADYDRDGKLDLYVTRSGRPGGRSWLEGRSGDPRGNSLFRNKGNWQFEDVTKASGTRGGYRSTFTAAWLDANNDGWPDLHVINEFGDGALLVNNGNGTFSEHALADRPADFGSMGLAVGDIDNDGNIDIYCANMYSKAGTRVIGNLQANAFPPHIQEKMRRFVAGSQMHLNKGGLKFEQVGKKMQVAGVGWAYGACLADLDNDGFLDIYATAGFVSRNRDEPDG